MRTLFVAAAAAVLAACAPPPKKETPRGPDLSERLVPDCYTVDLFDPYRIQYPEQGVPPQNAKFLGVWQNGGWSKQWCHDLYITEVRADGTVTLLDAYGPDRARRLEAQVYKRTARIENGVLRFLTINNVPVSYRLEDGYLIGERLDYNGKEQIVLSRTDGLALVPIPPRNPRRS